MGTYKSSLFIFFLFFLVSCRTPQVITAKEIVHDTLYHTKVKYDSIYHKDSIYIQTFQRGDTTFLLSYKERYIYKDRIKHDTLYKAVSHEKTQIKKVNELTRWQKMQMKGFRLCLPLCVVLLLFVCRKPLLKLIKL